MKAKLSKRDISISVVSFIAGILVVLCTIFLCVMLYSPKATPTTAPMDTNTPLPPTATRTPIVTFASTATISPTDALIVEICYLKLVVDEQLDATVYVSAQGENAVLFCETAVGDSSSDIETHIVDSVPDFPVWCTLNMYNTEIKVISEYKLLGEAACEGMNSHSASPSDATRIQQTNSVRYIYGTSITKSAIWLPTNTPKAASTPTSIPTSTPMPASALTNMPRQLNEKTLEVTNVP